MTTPLNVETEIAQQVSRWKSAARGWAGLHYTVGTIGLIGSTIAAAATDAPIRTIAGIVGAVCVGVVTLFGAKEKNEQFWRAYAHLYNALTWFRLNATLMSAEQLLHLRDACDDMLVGKLPVEGVLSQHVCFECGKPATRRRSLIPGGQRSVPLCEEHYAQASGTSRELQPAEPGAAADRPRD